MKMLYRLWLKNSGTTDDFERTKGRITLAFFVISMAVSIFYWIVAPLVSFNVPRVIFVALPLMLAVPCVLLLTGKASQEVVAQLFIGMCWLAFVAGAYFSGGIFSIVLPWLSLMPVMANLILNYKCSIIWFFVSLFTVAGFGFFQSYVPEVEFTEGPWRSVFSAIGLCLTLFFFTSLFDRARYRILQILKVKNSELKDRNLEIGMQNEEIKSQLEHIHIINAQLEEKILEIKNRNTALENHWNTLLELSKNRVISFGNLEEAINHILKVTAKSLGIDRVSLWKYIKQPERIECLMVYDNIKNTFSKEEGLPVAINTPYFQSIRKEKIIAVNDVYSNADTAGFVETYLNPKHILSMMDAPYFIDGELNGILCCEHQQQQHSWSCEDIIFATSMADIIALAYRCAMRNDYERNIREMNRKILTQNELLLHKSQEIERINQSLEERVSKRTEELMLQNKQLTEYAFINSHLLRGPLARIIGLVDIMQKHESKIPQEELLEYLKNSTTDLDQVINKITQAIDKGSHFNRENLS